MLQFPRVELLLAKILERQEVAYYSKKGLHFNIFIRVFQHMSQQKGAILGTMVH